MRLIATANEIHRVEREDSTRFIFRRKGEKSSVGGRNFTNRFAYQRTPTNPKVFIFKFPFPSPRSLDSSLFPIRDFTSKSNNFEVSKWEDKDLYVNFKGNRVYRISKRIPRLEIRITGNQK